MHNYFLSLPHKQGSKFENTEVFNVQFFIRRMQKQHYLDPLFLFIICVQTSFTGFGIDFLTRPLSIPAIALNHASNAKPPLFDFFPAFHRESVELNGDIQRSVHNDRTLSHGTLLRLYR